MNIKIRPVITHVLLTLTIALTAPTVFADRGGVRAGALASQIDYWFVAHLGQVDDAGRILVWEGTIDGAIKGEAKWWFEMEDPVQNSSFSFYAARWEIWSDGKLILAGESAGKTVFPGGISPGAPDGIWDGHGVVTEAKGKASRLKGRKIYETGPVVIGDTPPVSFSGTGMFLIY